MRMCQWVKLQWVQDVPLHKCGLIKRKTVITSFKEFFSDLAGSTSAWVTGLTLLPHKFPSSSGLMLRTSLPLGFLITEPKVILAAVTDRSLHISGTDHNKRVCCCRCSHSQGNPACGILLRKSDCVQWSKSPGIFYPVALPSSIQGSRICLEIVSISRQLEREKNMEDRMTDFFNSPGLEVLHVTTSSHVLLVRTQLTRPHLTAREARNDGASECPPPQKKNKGFMAR